MANGLMHIQQPPQGFSEFKRIFCKTPISYPNDPGTQHSGYLMHAASLSLPSTGKLNDCNTQKDIHKHLKHMIMVEKGSLDSKHLIHMIDHLSVLVLQILKD